MKFERKMSFLLFLLFIAIQAHASQHGAQTIW